jgi:sulfide:quinone oxidoreductase
MTPASRPHVLIAGGGVAAVEALLALRVHVGHTVSVELLAPEKEFVYRPASVAEPFGRGEARRFSLREIAGEHGAALRRGELTAVDTERAVAVTSAGDELSYDMLLVAVGAQPEEALPGAIAFRGPADTPAMARLLEEIERGEVARVVFALPADAPWPLPLYELAVMTAAHAIAHRPSVEIVLVTPEEEPLEVFGPEASDAVTELLHRHTVEVRTLSRPVAFDDGVLHLAGAVQLAADRVITLPSLAGPRIPGLPHDAAGFIPVDRHGLVQGEDDVYAAGDVVAFPLKQGGLAAQQADAAAEPQSIHARSGRLYVDCCSLRASRCTCGPSRARRGTRRKRPRHQERSPDRAPESAARSPPPRLVRCGGRPARSLAATWRRTWPRRDRCRSGPRR